MIYLKPLIRYQKVLKDKIPLSETFWRYRHFWNHQLMLSYFFNWISRECPYESISSARIYHLTKYNTNPKQRSYWTKSQIHLKISVSHQVIYCFKWNYFLHKRKFREWRQTYTNHAGCQCPFHGRHSTLW